MEIWLGISTFVIALVVRLLKTDTRVPISVSPRMRPLVAIALGIISACLAKVAAGATWKEAFLVSLSGAVAIVAHEVAVEGIADGKEPYIPGLIKKRQWWGGKR